MRVSTQISIDDLRSNLADVIGRVMYGNEQIVIKKYNREAAVIISQQEYEALKDPTKRLSKTEWNERFKRLDAIRAKIPLIDPDIVQEEVDKAVKEVRAEKRLKQ